MWMGDFYWLLPWEDCLVSLKEDRKEVWREKAEESFIYSLNKHWELGPKNA